MMSVEEGDFTFAFNSFVSPLKCSLSCLMHVLLTLDSVFPPILT